MLFPLKSQIYRGFSVATLDNIHLKKRHFTTVRCRRWRLNVRRAVPSWSLEIRGARGGHKAAGYDGTMRLWTLLGVSENSVPLNPMVNDHYP